MALIPHTVLALVSHYIVRLEDIESINIILCIVGDCMIFVYMNYACPHHIMTWWACLILLKFYQDQVPRYMYM